MDGIGETSNFTLVLSPIYHFDKIFFYYSPISSKEANGETIWARSLVWLEHPYSSSYFFFFDLLDQVFIDFLTDLNREVL